MIEQYDREKKAEVREELKAAKLEKRRPKSITIWEYNSNDMFIIVTHVLRPTEAELIAWALLANDEVQAEFDAREELMEGVQDT
jgi:hypothetical protein